jgi:hypothetical protein
MKAKYDLCLSWNWEYDSDFIGLLIHALNSKELSLLQVSLDNVEEFIQSKMNEMTTFSVYWNRTYGSEKEFESFVPWAETNASYNMNPYHKCVHASDKAAMHYILIHAGIYTPYTIILPSFKDQPKLPVPDLKPLKSNFIIKPARGAGGEGVVLAANTLQEIFTARQEFPEDRYLLQAHINPVKIDHHPAWFRVIYCTGNIYPCWWHPKTHIYTPVSVQDEEKYKLLRLRKITQLLAALTGLDFFSTEIAITDEDHFVVVDYVNDEIDLRLKSNAIDGVPDEILRDIVERIAMLVAHFSQKELNPVFFRNF